MTTMKFMRRKETFIASSTDEKLRPAAEACGWILASSSAEQDVFICDGKFSNVKVMLSDQTKCMFMFVKCLVLMCDTVLRMFDV